MKILRFLKWIQNHLVNYPDISLKTIKMFMDNFYSCLSVNESERYRLSLQLISEITSKQITIDEIVFNAKVENLENDLNGLKDDID